MTIGARVLLPLFLLPTFAGQSDPHPSADKVTVMGKVVDSHGMPVANAFVSAYPPMAELHTGARTAADGTFVFHVDPFGAGVVSAEKPEDGYPREWALYGKRPESTQPINATLANSPIQVELRFEEADAIIEWKVLSKADGSPLSAVDFSVAWSDDPHVFVRGGKLVTGGVFEFVLPKHPVLITISAKGFREWNSTDSREFGGPVLFTPGTRDERTILLEPVK